MRATSKFVIQSVFISALIGATSLAFMASGGCRAPAAGERVDLATYVRGDFESSLATDFNSVVEATHKAIKELGFTEISTKKDAFSAAIVARAAGGRKIEISIVSAGKDLTNMKIRVDLFGDEQLSRSLLGKIKSGIVSR